MVIQLGGVLFNEENSAEDGLSQQQPSVVIWLVQIFFLIFLKKQINRWKGWMLKLTMFNKNF